ncbi:MAG: plethodontid receptivity factor PRF [Bacteroidales bacterium]|nr:plethodontid receptivity factor PRF [Bacteroidales bacterium]
MKRTMIRTLLLSLCLMVAVGAMPQKKVLQKSAKKVPEWITSASEDYLVVSVDVESLTEAQTRVMEEIRQRIIRSVAVNVVSEDDYSLVQQDKNGVVNSTETITINNKIVAARLPFLKDVSEAKIEEIYWELYQDKSTKKERYVYSAKYPFSASERAQLIREFEQQQQDNDTRLNTLEYGLASVDSESAITSALTQLDELESYFINPESINKVKSLRNQYSALFSQISMSSECKDQNSYLLHFQLDGRPFKVNSRPKVVSESASQIQVNSQGSSFLITCDTEDCLPEEVNTLDVSIKLNGKTHKHTIYIKL